MRNLRNPETLDDIFYVMDIDENEDIYKRWFIQWHEREMKSKLLSFWIGVVVTLIIVGFINWKLG